jgi:hypothetical protein
MCWSTRRAVAEGHVRATEKFGNGPERRVSRLRRLWRSVVPPDAVLARIGTRGESEIVVDPSFLRDVTLAPPTRPKSAS